MNKKRGFTLVELLVVIAIIALLMAILMPALNQVKKAAKEAACQMNMRQMGIAFSVYTGDNNGSFSDGCKATGTSIGSNISGGWGDWLTALDGGYKFEATKTPIEIANTRDAHRALSYIKDYKVLTCPMASKPGSEIPPSLRAWGGGPGFEDLSITGGNVYLPYAPSTTIGGFAHNVWCNNPPSPVRTRFNIYKTEYNWRTTAVQGAGEVPVLMDAVRWGCSPQANNRLSELGPGYGSGDTDNEMPRVFLDRHNGGIDILWMDGSVRRTRIRDLYEVKWHRNWTNELQAAGGVPDFSRFAWMRNF